MDFPYKKISLEEAKRDYFKLKELKQEKMSLTTIGNKASNYFFQKERMKVPYKNKMSKLEYWKKNKENVYRVAMKLNKQKREEVKTHDLYSALSMIIGSINQFKPAIASFIYDYFKPKSILDFSCGWGDRLVAAMTRDIDYIGIDTNKDLKNAYRNMCNTYDSKSHITIIFKKSEDVDFSKYDYDFIFTSPPYYTIEKYENMPEYENFDVWIESYLQPTILNSWKYLKKNGFMCLNIPKNIFEEVKKILNKSPNKKFKMPIQNRFHDGEKKYEYIYCWKKE